MRCARLALPVLGLWVGLFAGVTGAIGASPAHPGGGRTAVWVVRDGITTPKDVEAICRAAREQGLDTLIVQVRGRGDAYYETGLAPRAGALARAPRGFDPLAEILKRSQGLRVLAWINVFLVWSEEGPPSDPSHPARLRQDWILRDREGRSLADLSSLERAFGWAEGIYVDPASPEYREQFARIAAEIAAKYPVDGLHLDFVRYPGPGYGKAGDLGGAFFRTWGFDPRWLPKGAEAWDIEAWLSGALCPSRRTLATAALLWADLRASQVTGLVRSVRFAVNAVRPGLELSAAVFPDRATAFLDNGQDWGTWASEGLVDALYPMAYFGGPERVGGQLAEISRIVRLKAPRMRLWAGLGGYRKDPRAIAAEAAEATALGYDGISLFDFGSLMKRAPGLKPYADAARHSVPGPILPGAQAGSPSNTVTGPREPETGPKLLASIVERAWSRATEPPADRGETLAIRWAEFEAARAGPIPRALARVGGRGCRVPAWVDLRGIFRYVHPLDGPERRDFQRRAAEGALARLQSGEDFGLVAGEVSQWSTRSHGGLLERRYLDLEDPVDRALAPLAPGELTGVVLSSKGYWVLRVEARGGGEEAAPVDLPWAPRRILFLNELALEMDPVAAGRSAPARDAPKERL